MEIKASAWFGGKDTLRSKEQDRGAEFVKILNFSFSLKIEIFIHTHLHFNKMKNAFLDLLKASANARVILDVVSASARELSCQQWETLPRTK